MKEFVAYIIRALVEHPDQVAIAEIYGRRNVILEVRCHAEDMGRVIGKNGKTIGSIRMLATNLAAKQGRKAVLEVVE
ncbi:MAG: KH domain-containing protein [Lentisphaerae bacterium]|nr:KH domain-containing protein [Lentisphaerota bacterium]